MDIETFERLLYEEESTTLDFKREQYRFVKATDDEKSELLKDLLGFANAWRRSEAYILTGVEEIRGGRANVVGIPAADHLDDHSLQQFVNSLTNQPVRFLYEAFGFEGKQVGIIRIDENTRPIYLKRSYGKLEREKVYVRRGSSTDPTKPASLEEIAQMRVGSGQPAADLIVEFAHVDRDDSLGTSISWNAEFCEMPPEETIPDLRRPRQQHPFGIDLAEFYIERVSRLNENLLRELADFEFVRRLFRPIRLVVRNVGRVAAHSVRAEITVLTNIGVMVMDADDMPDQPKQRIEPLFSPVVKGITPAFRRDPGGVYIAQNDERFRIDIECGDLQPGRRVWSDVFYIGKEASGDLVLGGVIFADNLPKPKVFMLTVSATVTETVMTVDDLFALSDLAGGNE